MTIQYCSDLHLEFSDNVSYLKAHPIVPAADVLILAGDIMSFKDMTLHDGFFDFVYAHFKSVYWLPGNHEYYGSDAQQRSGSFKEAIRDNVFLLNNEAVEADGVTLIFSTLWSAISPAAEWDTAKGMADYKVIRWGSERFQPQHSTRMHRACRRFIDAAVAAAKPGKILVATHHAPTFLNYPAQYRGSELNEAFATELFEYIDSAPIDGWIYGHHHSNTPDFDIGGTQMLTNQLGYVKYGEQLGYRAMATVTL